MGRRYVMTASNDGKFVITLLLMRRFFEAVLGAVLLNDEDEMTGEISGPMGDKAGVSVPS